MAGQSGGDIPFIGNYMIAKLVLATLFGLLPLGIHRKSIARIQRRPGPSIWQEILHMLKFSFKTTWIPVTASSIPLVGVVLIAIGIWTAAFYVLHQWREPAGHPGHLYAPQDRRTRFWPVFRIAIR